MNKKTISLLLALLSAASLPVSLAQSPSGAARYKDVKLTFEERAKDLVSKMTVEEKVSQLGHTADAIPRLGVPEYNWWNEGLHGVARAGVATVFPQAIALAATFDAPLIHQDADVISTEFRAKYNMTKGTDGSSDWYKGLTAWSPNINIFRDPRWGRGQETYGEDPYLTSRLGVAFVTGLQGDDPKYTKVVATPKHFAVHSGPEATRHQVDISVSRHDLEDTYLPAFRAAVIEGKADSVMCAYNSLFGQPACASTTLLQEHLRHDWGFQGYVVSDCGAVEDIYRNHHFTQSIEEGVAAALKSGTDLICGEPPQDRVNYERTALLNAVHQGLLSEGDIDRALVRLFTARFKLGQFDPAAIVPWSRLNAVDNDSAAHRQLALKTARESIVLLKNEGGFLPLKHAYKKIAVIGPDADSLDALVGNYNGTPSRPVTLLAGLRQRFPQSRITYVQGTGLTGTVTHAIPGSMLYTDASKVKHGLKAAYFSNIELKGSPALSRIDASVNFSWGFSGVSPKLSKNYSARWTGVLVPNETEDYLIGFSGQDGYRVWVDDDLVADDWTTHRPATTLTKQMHLEKGHAYAVKIEYFQTVRGAEARLLWGVPGREEKEAVDAARSADLVVVALGLSARIEGEEMKVHAEGFAGGDRTSIDLPGPEEQLLERVQAAGKPTVLVLMNGSALGVNWANDHLSAIVEAWYPGEAGGTAIAEALAGDFSPAGRLPVTFYKSVEQLPAFEDYSMARRTYRYFHGEPLYPFGYGLSYTSFAYSHLHVDNDHVAATGAMDVSVELTNTGLMSGDEVVQLYLTHPGVAGAPLRALEGFKRIHLERGQHTTVSFRLHDRDLSIVDEAGRRKIVPGVATMWVGGGQPASDSGLPKAAGVATQFTIVSGATLSD
jgi:beta-glucosidase